MTLDEQYRQSFPDLIVEQRERIEARRAEVEAASDRLEAFERLFSGFDSVGACSVTRLDGAVADSNRIRLRGWVSSLSEGPIEEALGEFDGTLTYNDGEGLFEARATVDVLGGGDA